MVMLFSRHTHINITDSISRPDISGLNRQCLGNNALNAWTMAHIAFFIITGAVAYGPSADQPLEH